MPLLRTRSLTLGLSTGILLAAGVAAARWLGAAEPPAGPAKAEAVPAPIADPGTAGDKVGPNVRIEAPGTKVTVDKDSGKVAVTAPHTDVHVDPEKGRVQVRAPYVNLDIRW